MTLLEGCGRYLGRKVQWAFLAYLIVWSFLVAAALMSAIGVVCHAMLPLAADSPHTDKIVYGIAHSVLAVALIELGGFRLFEQVMRLTIGAMFVVAVTTAVALQPPIGEVLRGTLIPTIPPGGVAWTVALMGGIGGTVTVLCYGYWIREEGRNDVRQLAACRIDLATAYAMTAVFGLSMVVIGSTLGPMEGGGATLMVRIAERLRETFGATGPLAKWAFLVGAWGAVFSSLLGVWQSTPYLFADLCQQLALRRLANYHTFGEEKPHCFERDGFTIDTRSLVYRTFLVAIALIPIVGLTMVDFRSMQKAYAIVGALFIPMLAIVLLFLNHRSRWIGESYRNSWATTAVLFGALVLFLVVGAVEIRDNLWTADS
jgi:Mn2+/Fe2+ NRAMP family transporter